MNAMLDKQIRTVKLQQYFINVSWSINLWRGTIPNLSRRQAKYKFKLSISIVKIPDSNNPIDK